jgi:hypothetical protein
MSVAEQPKRLWRSSLRDLQIRGFDEESEPQRHGCPLFASTSILHLPAPLAKGQSADVWKWTTITLTVQTLRAVSDRSLL